MSGYLTLDLIIRRNLKQKHQSENTDGEDVAKGVMQLTHIRLDRENLSKIDNLDCLGSVTNLYLQQNNLSRIQNLECLASTLRFLTLSGNQITRLEGLAVLKQLRFLDLSENHIKKLTLSELPVSLVFASFKNNPCCLESNYRQSLINHLPNLKSIDDEPISSDDSGSESDSSDEDGGNEGIASTTNDLLLKSVSRMDEVATEHRERLDEVENRQSATVELEKEQDALLEKSDLSNVGEKIMAVMQTMLEAEHDVMDKFDLFNITSSARTSPDRTKETSPSPQATSTPKTVLSAKIKPPIPSTDLKKPNPPSKMVTTGTTTSARLNSSKRPTKQGNHVATRRGNVPQASTSDAAKRVIRRFSSDSLVRIPGARPFHKS